MREHDAPRMVGIGAIFIDDIALPDGQTHMGQLGGGVTHALMGAALWDEKPGIVAVAGQGLSQPSLNRLQRHLDTRGLCHLDIPQIRAWQIFEHDGTRRELYRVDETAPFTSGAQPEHFPPSYRDSRAFYLLQGFDGIKVWRDALDGYILWEPLQQVMVPKNREKMRAVLQDHRIDLISPNLSEAREIYGQRAPEAVIDAMFEDGARAVALRMGAAGSLIANKASGATYRISAAAVPKIIDQTGAGNTYCGALLAGITQGKSLAEAGAMAAVAASFCLERVGVLEPDDVDVDERDRRYATLVDRPSA